MRVDPRSGRVAPVTPGLVVAALLALAGCGGGTSPRPPSPPASTVGQAIPSPSAPSGAASSAPSGAAPSGPTSAGPSACAARTLAGLTDAERVGQVFVVGLRTTSAQGVLSSAEIAARVHAGNYLLYGGTRAGVASVRDLTRRVDARLAAASGGVAPFAATDQEGGEIQSLAGPGFETIPSALVQGTWPAARLQESATRWGRQMRDAGITLDFAPVADVVPATLGTANRPIGRHAREYGHTPDEVAADVTAFVTGLRSAGVLATAKHFPGLGRVIGNTDVSRGVTDPVTDPRSAELEPFRAAVGAGVEVVMVSSAVYPAIDPRAPAVFSPATMSLLRDGLGFTGLIASDDLGAAVQVADVAPGERARRFLAAGGQLVVVVRPTTVVAPMVDAVLAEVRRDPAFRARVEAAALAVLAAKERAGLLAC